MSDPNPSKTSFEDRSVKFIGRHTKAIWFAIGLLAVVVVVIKEA